MISVNPSVRVTTVDDEPLARERVIHFLEDQPEFELAGSFGDGESALRHLFDVQPDVLLLDIEMPGLSGFDLLARLPEARRPIVIFITAFPEHAVQAFEVAALDYVLKPFRSARLLEALNRAKTALHERRTERPPTLDQTLEIKRENAVVIDLYGTKLMLSPRDIFWVVADGNYVKINAQGQTYFKRSSLSQMLALLEPMGFKQVHRSILINQLAVQSMRYIGNNAFQIEMKDGQTFRTGRAFKAAIQHMLSGE